MSKLEWMTTISYNTLMNKSKSELADLVLEYADRTESEMKALAEDFKREIDQLDSLLDAGEVNSIDIKSAVSRCLERRLKGGESETFGKED